MNIKKIKELVEIMNGNDLAEVEIEQEGTKIRLIKKGQNIVEQIATPHVSYVPHNHPATMPTVQDTAAGQASNEKKGKEIKAPMVGTFYRAPSPDADPYVQVGDTIKKGDVLCIVEAMKLMNEIKAEFGGKIVDICVENADAVEFGQVLFYVDPS